MVMALAPSRFARTTTPVRNSGAMRIAPVNPGAVLVCRIKRGHGLSQLGRYHFIEAAGPLFITGPKQISNRRFEISPVFVAAEIGNAARNCVEHFQCLSRTVVQTFSKESRSNCVRVCPNADDAAKISGIRRRDSIISARSPETAGSAPAAIVPGAFARW